MDDLAIAFAMRCDDQKVSHDAGMKAAERLADEIMKVADDRLYGKEEVSA
jgi:hypothetical protein